MGDSLEIGGSSKDSVWAAALDRALVRRRRVRDLGLALGGTGGEAALSERDRALLSGILAKLQAAVRQSLAAAVAEHRDDAAWPIAGLGSPNGLPPRPDQALFRIDGLVERALHRAMGHRLSLHRRAALEGFGEGGAVDALLKSPLAAVAAAAKIYLVDEARRVDGYGEPLLKLSDLDAAQRRSLLWRGAAGLRLDRPGLGDPAALDRDLETAVRALARDGDAEAASRPSLALAAALEAERAANPDFPVEILREGEVALFEAVIVVASGVDSPTVGSLLYDPDPTDFALLCQAAGWTAKTIDSLCGLLGVPAPAPVPAEAAERMLDYWRRDRAYRDALEEAASSRPAPPEE